jgi:hypothetical protein
MFKKCNKCQLFFHIILFALVGILVGIVLGLIFGALIVTILDFITTGDANVNLEMGGFFGMGCGAVIGGVFGAIVALKD